MELEHSSRGMECSDMMNTCDECHQYGNVYYATDTDGETYERNYRFCIKCLKEWVAEKCQDCHNLQESQLCLLHKAVYVG